MGGNALKNIYTRRYSAEDYFHLESDVVKLLTDVAPGLRIVTIPAYFEKESFGDMNIMIEYRDGIDYMNIVAAFSPSEVFRNGKVISFDYKELQIDLIITRSGYFDFSRNYYSYNDLGNLMGRIAHKMGMKYGHEGLVYVVRSDNHVIGSIDLTKDTQEAFDILDYDYDRFLIGFKNLAEIFEYVVSSKYFSASIFKLENRNHRSRVRDAKRPTYNAFLEYCNRYQRDGGYVFNSDKSFYIPMINSYFPSFREQLDDIMEKNEFRLAFKKRFNGHLVMNYTGLSGRDLGRFMAQYKSEDFIDWVMSVDVSEGDILNKLKEDLVLFTSSS